MRTINGIEMTKADQTSDIGAYCDAQDLREYMNREGQDIAHFEFYQVVKRDNWKVERELANREPDIYIYNLGNGYAVAVIKPEYMANF